MTTAFVTGGTGFLGQHLVRSLLRDGWNVRVLVRSPHADAARRLQHTGASLLPGDLNNTTLLRSALRDVHTVYHLAGQLYAPQIPDRVFQQVHVGGTQSVIDACRSTSSIRSIVHCSTTGVLGPTGAVPAAEDAPQRPDNAYERTKAEAERLALEAARDGLPLVVARPALVYGPGDLHLLGWFRAIKRGLYRVVGHGNSLFHPIYIDDLVRGLRLCARTPGAVGRAYHLVGARALPIRELAAAIAHALGTTLPRSHLPAAATWAGASLLEALPGVPIERLPLTRSRIAFMTASRAYCGDRARRELGFAPEVDLPDGLERAVTWYRGEGLL
jgi:nucleoside-diphosphate-sugar epimerase